MSIPKLLILSCLLASLCPAAEVPQMLHHQGRMAVNSQPFDGTGQFKFALVNEDGTQSYWSNNATSTAGSEPTAHLSLTVTRGLYSILLGDTGMSPLSATALAHSDVRLRVWFNDGTRGFQRITPDQRLVSAPYALIASSVDQVLLEKIQAAPTKPVLAWGKNTNSQTAVPSTIADANVTAISAKGNTSIALLKNGSVIRWGTGAAVPSGLTGVTHISAGVNHALALKSDGTLTAWGDNTHGQSAVSSFTNVSNIAAGEKHTLILQANGTVTTIGDATFNQVPAPALTGITAIASGYDHCLALDTTGKVTAWGRDETDQTNVPPAALTGVTAIAAGAFHSLALKSDGTVLAWGWNTATQCDVPAGLTGVRAIAAGYAFSAALKTDGSIVIWGDTTEGRLDVPPQISEAVTITAGDSHLLALVGDLIQAPLARLDKTNTFEANLGIRRSPAVNTLEVEGSASKTTAGNWLANSDRRIKTSIHPITDALATLDRVKLVGFRYTPEYLTQHPSLEDRTYLNVIAQEFAQVFPEHVKTSGETLPDGSDILQVDTYPLTIYSAAAVQELHRENTALRKQLDSQEKRLRDLEAAIAK
jgi:hypothetical protein